MRGLYEAGDELCGEERGEEADLAGFEDGGGAEGGNGEGAEGVAGGEEYVVELLAGQGGDGVIEEGGEDVFDGGWVREVRREAADAGGGRGVRCLEGGDGRGDAGWIRGRDCYVGAMLEAGFCKPVAQA